MKRLWLSGLGGLCFLASVGSSGAALAQTGEWPDNDGTVPPPPGAYPPAGEGSAADNPQDEDGTEARELEASFGPTLAPYGTWTDDPTFGRVWVPAAEVVGDSFAPYSTSGRWIYSEYGWTWDSDWEWGWAPFHYGRWAHLGGAGPWCWVPGTTWSPAWVAWRAGGGFAGWAPLAPRNAALDPAAWRTSWVFVRDLDLNQASPLYQPGARAGELYRQTAPVRETRLVTAGSRQVLVNPGPQVRGPAPSAGGMVWGAPVAPVHRAAAPAGFPGAGFPTAPLHGGVFHPAPNAAAAMPSRPAAQPMRGVPVAPGPGPAAAPLPGMRAMPAGPPAGGHHPVRR